MTTQNTDALKEACKVAGVLFSEEKTIESIEMEIAEKVRTISKKIFENNNFRMKTQIVGLNGDTDGIQVYRDVFIDHIDKVEWRDGIFSGFLTSLQITKKGDIVYVRHDIERVSKYDIGERSESYGNWDYAPNRIIAAHSNALAENMLKALKNRKYQSKKEKEVLQRMAQAI